VAPSVPAVVPPSAAAPAPLPQAVMPAAPSVPSVAPLATAAPVPLPQIAVPATAPSVPSVAPPAAAAPTPVVSVPSVPAPAATTMSADPTAQLMQYFRGQGWTQAQSAGIVANLTVESGLRPDAVGDRGAAFGLAQWHRDRRDAFKAEFGKPIEGSSLLDQAAFVQFELTHGESKAGRRLALSPTAADAGAAFSTLYERPADTAGNERRRGSLAEHLAAMPAVSVPTVPPPAFHPPVPTMAAAAPTLGAPVPTAFGPGRAAPATQPAQAPAAQHEILVRFENTPPGTRVETRNSAPGVTLSVDVGYAMAAP
jgi:Phage tail lysozyme